MVVGMIVRNGFPQPYHPVFDAPGFLRASTDRFFLCIERRDPRFDEDAIEGLFEECGALRTARVPLRDSHEEAAHETVAATI
jgi:hypothetical protein